MVNPVTAGLESKAERWPGWDTTDADFGRGFTCIRPEVVLRDTLTETVKLESTTAPQFDRTKEEFNQGIGVFRRRLQTQKRQEFTAADRRFMGAREVCRIDPRTRPQKRISIRESLETQPQNRLQEDPEESTTDLRTSSLLRHL
jgi:hypothetical protein